ncbi:hypothetical protein AB0N07_28575 [Streptomyces sp. NPDC051172]
MPSSPAGGREGAARAAAEGIASDARTGASPAPEPFTVAWVDGI